MKSFSDPKLGDKEGLKLAAVRSVIGQHLMECKAPERDYYLLPISKIARAIGASGATVREWVCRAGKATKLSESEKSTLTSSEFFGFGWLPQCGVIEKKNARIYVSKSSLFADLWSGELSDDRASYSLAKSASFESNFAQDRVLLGFQRYNYQQPTSDDKETKEWNLLPLLPPNAFSVLARLLPGIPWAVIGVSGGSSKTTPAGVLEGVIQFYDNQYKKRPEFATRLMGAQINHILEYGTTTIKRGCSPLDACATLARDKINQDEIERVFRMPASSLRSRARANALQKSLILLQSLLEKKANGSRASYVTRSILERFRLPTSVANLFEKNIPGATAEQMYQTMGCMEESLGENHHQGEKRNRERYPLPRLFQQIMHMCAGLFQRRLATTGLLEEWLNKRFRFIVILPVDSALPVARNSGSQPSGSILHPGDWYACRQYGRLFAEFPGEGHIPIPVDPLMELVRKALIPGSKKHESGWLAAKCSETNELVVSLMLNLGFQGQFDLEKLPLEVAKLSDLELLQKLDSRLLVRCVESVQRGALEEWIKGIAQDITNYIAGADLHGGRLPQLLDFLRDGEGLLSTAFDAARTFFPNPFYLCLERLPEVFQAVERDNIGTPGMQPPEYESRGSQDTSDPLLDALAHTPFDEKSVLDYLHAWEDTEGQANGETIGDLVADTEQTICELKRKAVGNKDATAKATLLWENLQRLKKLLCTVN
jgi:hypothetical protein